MGGCVVFRVDSSPEIGLGHLMRCLTLAQELESRGATCHFLMGEHLGHGGKLVTDRGHRLWMVKLVQSDSSEHQSGVGLYSAWLDNSWDTDAELVIKILKKIGRVDCLIVDHYGIDICWERRIRSACINLVVIDDLKNRRHDCDVLVDQNLGRTPRDYEAMVPVHCQVLVGTAFAMLRPQFSRYRESSLARRQRFEFKRLLVTMGGTDSLNVTNRVLKCLDDLSLPQEIEIIVVLGQSAPWIECVQCTAASMRWQTEIQVDVSDMAALMATCDVAIGAAGSSSWERCCLGIPTLMVVVAANQLEAAEALSNLNAVISVKDLNALEEHLAQFLKLCQSNEIMNRMSATSSKLVDGRGCERVVRVIETLVKKGAVC